MSDKFKKIEPQLGNNSADRTAAVLKSVAGLIPWAGTAFGEIITEIIPNQRIERIEKYLQYLAQNLEDLQIQNVQEQVKKPENVDFFEDGAYLATRALSDERIRYVASCIAEGISSENLDKTREKRILKILGEIDDEEILLLYGYCDQSQSGRNIFSELRPEPAVIGSSPEVVSEEALFNQGIENLERLGLIEARYPFLKDGDIPKFDANGNLEGGYRSITWLGRILLKKIGLIDQEI